MPSWAKVYSALCFSRYRYTMGKQFRASLAILDQGFAKGIRESMDAEDNTVA